MSMYDLNFDQDSGVNSSALAKVLDEWLKGKGCNIGGSDCTVGPLVSINVAGSNVFGEFFWAPGLWWIGFAFFFEVSVLSEVTRIRI